MGERRWPRVYFGTNSKLLQTPGKIPVGNEKPEKTRVTRDDYIRDEEVKKWVLEHSNGKCGSCEKAPFYKYDNEPYLEVHHITPLSEGGADTVNNTVALCPNCHKEIHHGVNGANITRLIKKKRGKQ